ncbi:MAG: glutathione S-transferase family protein [Pseudomonadota bacterium]
MANLTLYQYPLRACSTVTVNALIELDLPFEDRVIDIRAGEQYSPAYRKIHPYGKVPALLVDTRVITENVAILLYLDALRPGIILPSTSSSLERAAIHTDLVWCTATMHPTIRQVRMPIRYTDGDVSGVQQKGIEDTIHLLDIVEARVANDRWWYGAQWSILDVYVNWGLVTALSTDLIPLDDYPAIRAHIRRVRGRASFQSALARQTRAMEEAGLTFPDEASWNAQVG